MANNTILKTEDISEAKTKVGAYRTTCDDLFVKISNELTQLTSPGAGFNGASAVGYMDFFAQVTPILTKQLTAPTESVTGLLDQILDAVGNALLENVDNQLAASNRNAGVTGQ